jgi:hypothetical protein
VDAEGEWDWVSGNGTSTGGGGWDWSGVGSGPYSRTDGSTYSVSGTRTEDIGEAASYSYITTATVYPGGPWGVSGTANSAGGGLTEYSYTGSGSLIQRRIPWDEWAEQARRWSRIAWDPLPLLASFPWKSSGWESRVTGPAREYWR